MIIFIKCLGWEVRITGMKDSLCSFNNCNIPVFNNGDKCALHCEKHDYQTDSHSGLLQNFYNNSIEYVISKILNTNIPNIPEKKN